MILLLPMLSREGAVHFDLQLIGVVLHFKWVVQNLRAATRDPFEKWRN